MIKEPSIADAQRKMQVMAGIVSMLSTSPELADVAEEALVAPRRAANRVLIERAIARGEVTDAIDVDLISSVGSAMVAQRLLVERKPVTRAFLLSIIDLIVLPAVGLRARD